VRHFCSVLQNKNFQKRVHPESSTVHFCLLSDDHQVPQEKAILLFPLIRACQKKSTTNKRKEVPMNQILKKLFYHMRTRIF